MPVQLFSERIASKAIAKLFSGSNARISCWKLVSNQTTRHRDIFLHEGRSFPLSYTSLQLCHPLFCMTAFCTCKVNSKVFSRVLDCVKQMSSTASAFSNQIVAVSVTSDIRPEQFCKMSWCRCSSHVFVRIIAFRTSQRVVLQILKTILVHKRLFSVREGLFQN